MKKILFIAALCFVSVARPEQDALSAAIRETNIEKVEQLVKTVPASHLAYYCSLADQIITLRREQRMNAELLCSMDKTPPSEFRAPDGYRYASLFFLGVAGYGLYQICNEKIHGLITLIVALIVAKGIDAESDRLTLNYLKQNYEKALNVKGILAKKQLSRGK